MAALKLESQLTNQEASVKKLNEKSMTQLIQEAKETAVEPDDHCPCIEESAW